MNEFGNTPLSVDAAPANPDAAICAAERFLRAPLLLPGGDSGHPGIPVAANELCVRSDGADAGSGAQGAGGRAGRVSAKQIVEALEDSETFAQAARDDLRAPLRQMRGYASLIVSAFGESLPREAVELLQRVDGVARRMDDLLQGLAAMAAVSRRRLKFAPCDLSAVAASVLERLGQQSAAHTVKIEPRLSARADAWLVRILLENLLANAWKFSSRTANPAIEFGRTERDGRSWFFVRDNGAGFDMQYEGTLFEPFHRLHSQREFEGTGLGLAIAQRVVHRHGGAICAASAPGQGAIFYFTLD